jgi:hypothetical protein
MLAASAQRAAPTTQPPTRSSKHPKEPAMRIGEDQEEFEILPTEDDQPALVPEPEPGAPPQPEDAPA